MTGKKIKKKKLVKWNRVKTIEQTYELIDQGVIVKWTELKSLTHRLPLEQHEKLVEHLVRSICATTMDRLRCEVSVETLLLWLASSHRDANIKAGVEQFFNEKNAEEGIMKMVEIALTGEISDPKHQETAYAAAVMFLCALAKTIEQRERVGDIPFVGAQKIIPQMTTYLLSVSNLNDYVIRLSLLHYFGYMAEGGKNQAEFEKLLNRFGYTVLDYLFSLLFKKKSEGLALQFLLENFSYFLEASSSSQRIIHEILKYYLLKRPDRCSLFLQTLGDKLNKSETPSHVTQSYLQHLGALLHVVAKVNHKPLTKDLLSCIYRTPHPYIAELSLQIQSEEALDSEDKEFARDLEEGHRKGVNPLNFLRSHRRGRHPSFHLSKPLEVFEQVALLGNVGALGRVT
jgi:hypothetical protein